LQNYNFPQTFKYTIAGLESDGQSVCLPSLE